MSNVKEVCTDCTVKEFSTITKNKVNIQTQTDTKEYKPDYSQTPDSGKRRGNFYT